MKYVDSGRLVVGLVNGIHLWADSTRVTMLATTVDSSYRIYTIIFVWLTLASAAFSRLKIRAAFYFPVHVDCDADLTASLIVHRHRHKAFRKGVPRSWRLGPFLQSSRPGWSPNEQLQDTFL